MKLIYHPAARRDVRQILDYYDARSDTAGDRFFTELQQAEKKVEEQPTHCHFIDTLRRRCNLKKFPFHMIFEVSGDEVHVLVVRHHRRHQDYGLRRRWR